MIKFIKNLKKSKITFYILRDFDGNIIDATTETTQGYRYYKGNNEISYEEYANFSWSQHRQLNIRQVPIPITELNYEECKPFAFEASFKIVGYSSTTNCDLLEFELLNAPNISGNDEPFQVSITTASFAKLIQLLESDPKNFRAIISSDYSPSTWNNTKLIGFKGLWKFEFNKSVLAVTPYV